MTISRSYMELEPSAYRSGTACRDRETEQGIHDVDHPFGDG